MKQVKLWLFISSITLFIAACSNQTATTNQNVAVSSQSNVNKPIADINSAIPADEFAASRKIFKDQNCVRCHKDDGSGGATEIDGEKFKTPDLRSEKMKNAKDEEFIKTIEDGDEEMPGYKTKLKPEEIKELVRFIRVEVQRK
jgi:mono/diheme cytochrome c family protein